MLESAARPRLDWSNTLWIVAVHAVAVLGFFTFSWGAFLLAMGIWWVTGGWGITLGFHRLLTHRGLTLPKWLEHAFAVLGVCCLQDSPARWVAVHRLHHRHSDERPDPHTPLVSFFWAHVGWVLVHNR